MMKKITKNAVLAVLMFVLLFSLVGCGEDKLVATTEISGMKATYEVTFKDDVAKEMKMTIECDSKDDAKDGAKYFEDAFDGAKVKQSGKNIIITMDMDKFAEEMGMSENKDQLTKENLTKAFEAQGCEIKK